MYNVRPLRNIARVQVIWNKREKSRSYDILPRTPPPPKTMHRSTDQEQYTYLTIDDWDELIFYFCCLFLSFGYYYNSITCTAIVMANLSRTSIYACADRVPGVGGTLCIGNDKTRVLEVISIYFTCEWNKKKCFNRTHGDTVKIAPGDRIIMRACSYIFLLFCFRSSFVINPS